MIRMERTYIRAFLGQHNFGLALARRRAINRPVPQPDSHQPPQNQLPGGAQPGPAGSAGLASSDRLWIALAIVLGFASFAIVLAYHRIADGDLWARLIVGAAFWKNGGVPRVDTFAFTPVLPAWTDHEWGAGVIFYSLLKCFGPSVLMIFKIATAWAALLVCGAAARLKGTNWQVLLLLAILCALAVLPGFVTVVRSQVFSFMFFAVTLFCLELIRRGGRWPAGVIVAVMLVWANVHGGFVVGLGVIAVYAVAAVVTRQSSVTMTATLLASLAVTCLNPYGTSLWSYLVPALLHPRSKIPEWGAIPIWGTDPYWGFRLLFVIAVVALAKGFKRDRSWIGLAVLVLTAWAAWRHRRHAPFFGLAALVYLGPVLEAGWTEQWKRVPAIACFVVYGLLSTFVCTRFLPQASLRPAAPQGFYPAAELNVLAAAQARGNLAVPFRWGSYALWRLSPGVKVSMDGRYEETYPDTTFDMNHDFFYKEGRDWDRLLRTEHVDFIVLEQRATLLRPEDLQWESFGLVCSDGISSLWARNELVPALSAVASNHPPKIDPFSLHLDQ
jgi:hypothetical protein